MEVHMVEMHCKPLEREVEQVPHELHARKRINTCLWQGSLEAFHVLIMQVLAGIKFGKVLPEGKVLVGKVHSGEPCITFAP
ncbi:hypothetical protein GOBAR_DD08222 [Gossypium barbadense]|nr:hypothetical protein GOBAR_DD08222 [Gossypium barbadense]